MTQNDSREKLKALLEAGDLDHHLDRAALAIGADEYPNLDEAPVFERLRALAAEVVALAPASRPLPHRLTALGEVLGQVHGFRGNAHAYGDPRNSFLNEVLERKVGIPISLSVLYQSVAMRAGIPLYGVAFPGHFLACAGEGERRIVLDPFHGGEQLQPDGLRKLLSRTAPGVTFSPHLLRPASGRQIVFRMLTNLKHVYLAGEDWARALRVVELLLVVAPEHPGELRARASVLQSLGAYSAALHDVQHCLALSPDAPDASALRWTAQALASRAGWRS